MEKRNRAQMIGEEGFSEPRAKTVGPCPGLFQLLADTANQPVIFDGAFRDSRRVDRSDQQGAVHGNSPWKGYLERLRGNGFRIVEQRFPRLAFIIVGYPEPEEWLRTKP